MNTPHRSAATFPVTHWTMVRDTRSDDPKEAAQAMTLLCERYWYPIYAFLRRSGHSAANAEDLTQTFFQRLIERETIQSIQHEDSRLRSFLLGCLKQMLSDEARHANTQKRGGRSLHISFEEMGAEKRYALEPVDHSDPATLFSHAWAHELFANVRDKLKTSFTKSRRAGVFDALLPFVTLEDEPPSYRDTALKLGSSEASCRILVFRLREKFRELLKEEIALTTDSPEEVVNELAWLRRVLAGAMPP
jgi:DNA-directed RNA polymerase specialized sigma24 family protein